MSSPIPVPRIPRDRQLREDTNNNSALSLPHPASIRSSVTGFSDNHYEVGTVDLFSPRPTIRYSMQSPGMSGALRSTAVSRTDSRWDGESSPRQVLKESKTIDDLADKYDATTLRELMERDQRRRERKRKVTEEERARRKHERQAAKERGEHGPSSKSKRRARSPRTEMAEHRKKEREAGLGLLDVDAGPLSSKRPRSSRGPQSPKLETNEQETAVKETEDLSRQNPFNDPTSEVVTPVDEPIVATAEAVRYSQASMSPPASPVLAHARKPSNISQITDPRSQSGTNLVDMSADGARRTSETAAKRGGALAALFRKSAPPSRSSGEKIRGDALSPTFSNTSRESMRAQALRERTSLPAARSGTPTRTMSKFREDLPESITALQGSSRTSSPVDPPVPSIPSRQREKLLGEPSKRDAEVRNDSMGSATAPSAAVLSQSLASVDSEGSWLSGKPAKRSSQQMTPQMVSERPEFQGSYENLGVTDEEYFRRQAPGQPRGGLSGIQVALGKTKGDDEQATSGQRSNEERITGGNVSHQPTIVREERKKSSEGLLSHFEEGESNAKPTSPVSASTEADAEPTSPEEDDSSPKPVLGHARSVSRGSARLLEIPSRRSSAQPSKPEEASSSGAKE